MTAYYNEIDKYAAAWLRNLIAAGLIAPGDVDERDIRDVRPDDLRGYTQCHFFAGVGVWSYALRLAGWPDDRPIWTGSCPCQPFSAAGRRTGFADERHLWPHWFRLIRECRPNVVAGEQVASKDGLTWLDLVLTNLEDAGYACGAVDLCAAGIGAPHIRQRLYWVAGAVSAGRSEGRPFTRNGSFAGGGSAIRVEHAQQQGLERHAGYGGRSHEPGRLDADSIGSTAAAGGFGRMADPDGRNAGDGSLQRSGQHGQITQDAGARFVADACGMADAAGEQWNTRRLRTEGEQSGAVVGFARHGSTSGAAEEQGGAAVSGRDWRPGPANGFWRDADWLFCRDGKWRPVEPGTFPLAHGAPARVGRLRAYGNAIVSEAAAAFIASYIEARALMGRPTPG